MEETLTPTAVSSNAQIGEHGSSLPLWDSALPNSQTLNNVPAECGVMVASGASIEVVRVAPKQSFTAMRFDVWMALAKATPIPKGDDGEQVSL